MLWSGKLLGVERPTEATPITVAPRLVVLPTQEMMWENFELLLRRLAQEVRGLRQVQLYGSRGQAQFGIDIVGRAADDTFEAIQGKRYEEFTKADLTKAATTFLAGRKRLPFDVSRLFIAAGCDVERTEIVNELNRLNQENPDLEIEMWDRRRIGDMLRDRRDIVTEFFGEAAADLFCMPSVSHVVTAPSADRVDVADAVIAGPVKTVGADQHVAAAARLEAQDPAAAAREIEAAERLLTAGGFAAHAAVLTRRRADLLVAAGEHDEAAALLSDHFWQALDAHDTDEADGLSRSLEGVAAAGGTLLLSRIAKAALDVAHHPLHLPNVDLAGVDDNSVRVEFARLVLLMAETSAIDPGSTWTRDNIDAVRSSADAIDGAGEQTLVWRLRIEVADVTEDWTALVKTARRQRVDRRISALILARSAMHHAERGRFDEADESWELAIQHACLDGRNGTAAEFVHSRQILHSRHMGPATGQDDFPRLAKSLRALGDERALPIADRLEVQALSAVAEEKVHVAAPRLRAFLRFAHARGSWGQVGQARVLLADTYHTSGEHELAAALLILAGQAKKAQQVATAAGDDYLDVRAHLSAPSYWVSATAFRVLATQADLVPDDHVDDVVNAALDLLRRATTNDLRDTPFFGPSLATEALRAAAAVSDRMTTQQATVLLDYLRPLAPREANRYRITDDHHVQACVNIAATNTALRDNAFDQLLSLLEVSTSDVSQTVARKAADLFLRHADTVRERIAAMAEHDNQSAATLLARMTDNPTDEQLAAARAAANKLATPSGNTATSIGLGTGAVMHSLLARHLPVQERKALVAAQLEHAASAFEPGMNRADYYLAAANLADDLNEAEALFEETMRRASDQTPTQGDLLVGMGNHPLSTFRMSGMTVDTRPHATLLAAKLARTSEQKNRVRDQAISLLGVADAGYLSVRALQVLAPQDLANFLPFLAVHQDWAARSLAAITWAQSSPTDPAIGLLLAEDPDQRVRRALAGAVRMTSRSESVDAVTTRLAADRRFSVRVLLARVLDAR